MLHQLLNPTALLSSYGAIGLFAVLFAETGLLVGFFLPGDSLLFAAGLASATTPGARLHMNLAAVMAASAAGALTGAQAGYLIGRSAGPALLRRSRSGKIRHGAERAAAMLDRYGPGKAVLLARFIPVVRTVANPVAGALGVRRATFTLWQVVGGLIWSLGVTAAGYGLGSAIPGVDQYLLPAIALIIVISLLPIAIEAHRQRRARQERPARGDTVRVDTARVDTARVDTAREDTARRAREPARQPGYGYYPPQPSFHPHPRQPSFHPHPRSSPRSREGY